MKPIDTTIRVLERCDLLYDGKRFSREPLIQAFLTFLVDSSNKKDHSTGVILHTGSIIFDAVLIIYAAISNVVLNEMSTDELVSTLRKGDTVLYGIKSKSRYIFEGFQDVEGLLSDEFIFLSQGDSGSTYVPRGMWTNILPYYGESKTLDGRGIRKLTGKRRKFYTQILGFKPSNIPSVIDTSSVIVMERKKADKLIKGLSIEYDDEKIKLLELVTASFYTENNEIPYAGNKGKTEPAIKITSKASVARKHLVSRRGNRHIGLIVCGNDNISKGLTELPELINRRSLKYSFLSTTIDTNHFEWIEDQTEELDLFCCTKKYLKNFPTKVTDGNIYTNELARQVSDIIYHKIEPVIIEGNLAKEQYVAFLNALNYIRFSDVDHPKKTEFIIQSHSIMNLFSTAVFSMQIMEKMIKDGRLPIISPKERINELEHNKDSFPKLLKQKAQYVVDTIKEAYSYLYNQSEKESILKEVFYKSSSLDIALVVPKEYYIAILQNNGLFTLFDSKKNLTVSTVNRFDNTRSYDKVISVGDIEGTKFSIFRCRVSKEIIPLLYSYELTRFESKVRKASKIEKKYNHDSSVIQEQFLLGDQLNTEVEEKEHNPNIGEYLYTIIEEYVKEHQMKSLIENYIAKSASSSSSEIQIIVSFENDQKAFFTKNYKPYVFDENSQETKETRIEDLREGDSLVFTQNNEETKDIVDYVLLRLIEDKKIDENSIKDYKRSKYWKSSLINYMNSNKLTARVISDELLKTGLKVEAITILNWLDEDSRIVGPQNKDSILHIASLIGDQEMFDNYEIYHNSCRNIRRLRKDILKTIGDVIIQKINGIKPKKGTLVFDIYDRLDSLSQMLTIESILYKTMDIPIHMINRPVDLKE